MQYPLQYSTLPRLLQPLPLANALTYCTIPSVRSTETLPIPLLNKVPRRFRRRSQNYPSIILSVSGGLNDLYISVINRVKWQCIHQIPFSLETGFYANFVHQGRIGVLDSGLTSHPVDSVVPPSACHCGLHFSLPESNRCACSATRSRSFAGLASAPDIKASR